jgi:hypothetical protein
MMYMNKMQEMKMLKIVDRPAKALANIQRFDAELRRSPDLQARLGYARAWYAHRDEEGKWCFAPSKFAGYEDIDAKTYLQYAEESDGRRTEAQLQAYFAVVNPATPLHQELKSALFALLARYGKTPSTKMRINVLRPLRKLPSDAGSAEDATKAVVDMMVAVARTLPTSHFQYLREQLEDMSA